MIQITRHNSWLEISGASNEAIDRLRWHLAIPIAEVPPAKEEMRFASWWIHDEQIYATLVRAEGMPAGLLAHAQSVLRAYGYAHQVVDARLKPPNPLPLWQFVMPWRPYQNDVQQRLILNDAIGVIEASPRSGKTAIAMRAIDSFSQPTLYVAPSVSIVAQTYRRMVDAFGEDQVARLDGDARPFERDESKLIVVATIASALKLDPRWFKTRHMLVLDECHHAASLSLHRLNRLCSHVYHRIGLSGTYFRSGEDELAMHAVCGQPIFSISPIELVARGYLARPRVVFAPIRHRVTGGVWPALRAKGIAFNKERNETVAKIARVMAANEIPTIIIAGLRKHADRLAEMIEDSCVVKGGNGALTDARLEEFRQGNIPTLIGTSVIGEGVDLPNAGALIYAAGGNGTVAMLQAYFRSLTANDGKDLGRVFDFDDLGHETLRRQSASRRALATSYLGKEAIR